MKIQHALVYLAGIYTLPMSFAEAVEVIAHRGASHAAPENTLSSLRLAWEEGAGSAEIDIRLTKDGKIVLMHDDTLERTAGRPSRVTGTTLEELQTLDAGRWKNATFIGERIPTLDAALAEIPPGRRLVVEIKCGTEIIPPLLETLRQSGKPSEEIIFVSFDYDVLKALKRQIPAHRAYWLLSHESNFPLEEIFSTYIALSKEAGLDGLNLSAEWPLDEQTARRVLDSGLRLLVWTIDDPDQARAWIKRGVTAVTTNRPGFMMEALGVPKVKESHP